MDEGKFFNINTMLKNVFESLGQQCDHKHTDLVFIFGKSVPCQFKGDVTTLYIVLVKILCQVLKEYDAAELVLEVNTPEEFLHKEKVTFTINNISQSKDLFMCFVAKALHKDIEKMEATLGYSEDKGGSLKLDVPLVTAEMGCRRHYRMPSKSMLHKNILLLIESNNLALSLTKMFNYFPMNIALCIKKCKEDKYDLSEYDLVLVEEKLFDFQLQDHILKAKKKSSVQFVLLGDHDIYSEDDENKLHISYLKKPVTPEAVYKLLIELFDELPILT